MQAVHNKNVEQAFLHNSTLAHLWHAMVSPLLSRKTGQDPEDEQEEQREHENRGLASLWRMIVSPLIRRGMAATLQDRFVHALDRQSLHEMEEEEEVRRCEMTLRDHYCPLEYTFELGC